MTIIRSTVTHEHVVELDPEDVQQALAEYAKKKIKDASPGQIPANQLTNSCAMLVWSENFSAYEASVTFTTSVEDEHDVET
jgi:hypothetical protein